MAKSLDGLAAFVGKRLAERSASKCRTCRSAAICSDTDNALRAAVKDPKKYRGVSIPALWEWSGARAAGIGVSAYRVHIVNHRGDLWRALGERAE